MGNCGEKMRIDEDEMEEEVMRSDGSVNVHGPNSYRHKRHVAANDDMLWEDGIIPYEMDHSLDFNRDRIERAMQTIEKYSRIKFIERTYEDPFLTFSRLDGCYFQRGYGKHPRISLGIGCDDFGTVLHELMHAIGFPHEHRRPDRDEYITIYWNNIKRAEFRNPMINEGLFEGDIMGIDPNEDRNAVPRDSMRWPNGVIPYEVDPSLYSIWELLMKSIRHIEENSCIRFVPKTTETNYVRMFKGNGCWSFWGMLGNGEQKLSLGNGCHYFGTVVHEFLHALGFEHEHNRSDRDDYLTINWENIEQQWYYAFKKLRPDQNRLLSSFDYDSIMLYGEKSFAKSWSVKSMTAKDGRFLDEAYNKPGMSPGDIARLNKLYNCPSK